MRVSVGRRAIFSAGVSLCGCGLIGLPLCKSHTPASHQLTPRTVHLFVCSLIIINIMIIIIIIIFVFQDTSKSGKVGKSGGQENSEHEVG